MDQHRLHDSCWGFIAVIKDYAIMGNMDVRAATTSHDYQLMVNGQAGNDRFPDDQLDVPSRRQETAGLASALAGKALDALSESDTVQIKEEGSGSDEGFDVSDVADMPDASTEAERENPAQSQPVDAGMAETVVETVDPFTTKESNQPCAAESIFHGQKFLSLSGLIDRIAEQGYAMTQEDGIDASTDKETIKAHLNILFHVYANPSGKGTVEISQQQFEKMTEDGLLIIDQSTKTISFPVKVADFVEDDDWWEMQQGVGMRNDITNFIEKVGDAATTNTP